MRKFVDCPQCGCHINAALPDVDAAEAARLKAADLDRRAVITCPLCQAEIKLLLWDLPGLPEAPTPP